jgi:general secretion pathway protein H
MSSASAPTARAAARARTPTSAPGSSRPICSRRARLRGFTLIELLVVVALVAIAAGVATFALPDLRARQLEQEALRLAVLLEAARADARASGLAVRWEPASADASDGAAFRFIGLPPGSVMPQRWLGDGVSAEIVGARAVQLGPEPLIGAQRIVLKLAERRVDLATDGLGPFTIVEAAP